MNYFLVGLIFLGVAYLSTTLLKGAVAKNLNNMANLIGTALIAYGVIDMFLNMSADRATVATETRPFGGADVYKAAKPVNFEELGGQTEKHAADAHDFEGGAETPAVKIDQSDITVNGINASVNDSNFAPIDDSHATISHSLYSHDDIVASAVPDRANTNKF